MSRNLGKQLCEALPGYHAFTGCDYTAPMTGKGKVMPLLLMEKQEMFI